MKLRSFVVAALGVALLTGVTACVEPPPPPPPPPASTVDQSVPYEARLYSNSALVQRCASNDVLRAQTFIAGRSGSLDKVSLYGTGDLALRVEIRTVDAEGKPTGTVIGSGAFPGPFAGNDVPVDIVLSAPATVVAGTQYALTFKAAPDCVADSGATLPLAFDRVYDGGTLWSGRTAAPDDLATSLYDSFFRTFVR